jgi:septal ring factor EnvC (AmiA/AmiB activator)
MSIGSIFSSLFSTATSAAGSAVGGVFSSVKAYIMAAVVVVILIMATALYWEHSQNQILVANQAKLEDALTQEKNSFDQLKKDSDSLIQNMQDLQTKENEIQKQNDLLNQQIRQYDFSGNAIENPDATQKIINDQTNQMLRNFENLSDPNNMTSPTTPIAPRLKKGK